MICLIILYALTLMAGIGYELIAERQENKI